MVERDIGSRRLHSCRGRSPNGMRKIFSCRGQLTGPVNPNALPSRTAGGPIRNTPESDARMPEPAAVSRVAVPETHLAAQRQERLGLTASAPPRPVSSRSAGGRTLLSVASDSTMSCRRSKLLGRDRVPRGAAKAAVTPRSGHLTSVGRVCSIRSCMLDDRRNSLLARLRLSNNPPED